MTNGHIITSLAYWLIIIIYAYKIDCVGEKLWHNVHYTMNETIALCFAAFSALSNYVDDMPGIGSGFCKLKTFGSCIEPEHFLIQFS